MWQKLTDFAVRMRSLSKRTRVILTVLAVLAGLYATAMQVFSDLLEHEELIYSYKSDFVQEIGQDAPIYADFQKHFPSGVPVYGRELPKWPKDDWINVECEEPSPYLWVVIQRYVHVRHLNEELDSMSDTLTDYMGRTSSGISDQIYHEAGRLTPWEEEQLYEQKQRLEKEGKK